jgi:hypothetical protein
MKRRTSKEQRQDIATVAAMKDSDIDLTDMPEVLDWSSAEIGRFYRGVKKITHGRKNAGERKKS